MVASRIPSRRQHVLAKFIPESNQQLIEVEQSNYDDSWLGNASESGDSQAITGSYGCGELSVYI